MIDHTDIYRNTLDFNDIYQSIIKEIGRWFKDELVPNASEFLLPLQTILSGMIATQGFICRVEGVGTTGMKSLVIGSKTLAPFDPQQLSVLVIPSEDMRAAIIREYTGTNVMIGQEVGSKSVAQEKFYYHADMCLSVLCLYACLLFRDSIHHTRVRLVNVCFGAYGQASCIRWDVANKTLFFTRYYRTERDLSLDDKQLAYLKQTCFFDELVAIIEKDDRNQLEDAIAKAIHWFGDACNDKENVGKWIKLWSCIECFFSGNLADITESNARGVATLLYYGGYRLPEFDDYAELKAKVKSFYAERSKAVHSAVYTHINSTMLSDFSHIVAWAIIVMTSLSTRGYTCLAEIRGETKRLDAISTPPDSSEASPQNPD
ncbi:MAG: hypothetical protein ABFE01_10260 [Phycisphaerales bacterium]